MVQMVAGPSNHLGQMAQIGRAELKHTSIQVPLRQGLPDGAEILTPIASLSQVPARLLHVLDRIPLTAQETGALGNRCRLRWVWKSCCPQMGRM